MSKEKEKNKLPQFPIPILNERPPDLSFEEYKKYRSIQKKALRDRVHGVKIPVYTKKQLEWMKEERAKQDLIDKVKANEQETEI